MNNQKFPDPESQKNYSEIYSSGKLKPISQLLKESWIIYCLKIKTLVGIIGLPIGFSFSFWILIDFLAGTSLKYSIWFSVIEAISFLGSLFLWLLAIPSLLYHLKENSNLKESYKRGFKILGSYIWIYFLLVIIIAGGFLLFIIPGVLFSIWFSLAIFILIFEEKKGFNALWKSKHLVRGKFWKVLVRFLALGLIVGIGSSLIFALIIFGIENKQIEDKISEITSYFLRLFILPFFLIYGFLIFNNLKEIKTEVAYQKPALSKKVIYVIPGILGILFVGLLMSILFFNIFFGRDEPPVDDKDLWLSRIEIPKEENAFYLLSEGSKKIYLPKEKEEFELFTKMIEGEKWDPELAEELIKNNEEVFSYFEKALELPYFQIPQLQDPKTIGFETIIPGISGLRDIARLNLIRANYLFSQGKEKESLDLIIKTIKMGQMIEDGPRPALISYLVGMAIKEIGLQRLRTMIPNLTLSPEILKDYVADLDQFKKNEEGLIKVLKMDYIHLTNTKSKIDAAFTGKATKQDLEKLEKLEMLRIEEISFEMRLATELNYLYKPNQNQGIFAEYYRNYVDNANKDCGELKLVEIKSLVPHSRIRMLFTENIVGKIFHDVTAVSFSGLFDKKCLEDFSVIGTQSLMAIKAYQLETGKIPSSLDELVPKYFSEVPKDPFDGKLIKYSPEKKIIYSVGGDLKDSGGGEGKNWQIMEDPTFKIEF